MTVLGTKDDDISPAIAGIAGMGHILLTIALVMLFVALKRAISTDKVEDADPAPVGS